MTAVFAYVLCQMFLTFLQGKIVKLFLFYIIFYVLFPLTILAFSGWIFYSLFASYDQRKAWTLKKYKRLLGSDIPLVANSARNCVLLLP